MRRPMILPAALWSAGALVYLVTEAVAAVSYPGYDYARDYISDLGRPDSPRSAVMNAGFAVQGVLFTSAAYLTYRALPQARCRRAFLASALCYGVGMIVVATIPSGPESVDHGLGALHPVGAGLALVGGNTALLIGGIATFRSSITTGPCRTIAAIGGAGLAAVALLLAGQAGINTGLPEAVWERVAAYAIVGGEVLIAGAVVTGVRGRRPD